MIIGKVMMIQNSNPIGSVDYLISKRAIELKDNLRSYTLQQFIDEIGVSKTSMIRYLKAIGIESFTRFKEVMCEEYMRAYIDLQHTKMNQPRVIKQNIKDIAKVIQKSRKVVVLGDGNRFALLLLQKALVYLDVDIDIPVYLGSEESIIEKYNLCHDDLIIFVSLHETYDDFLMNRSLFYKNASYLYMKTDAKIGFVGVTAESRNEQLIFEYPIAAGFTINKAMDQLQQLFLDIVYELLVDL